MSAHMASFSYDGDAASDSAANAARSQSKKQVTDTIMAGNDDDGVFDGDTRLL